MARATGLIEARNGRIPVITVVMAHPALRRCGRTLTISAALWVLPSAGLGTAWAQIDAGFLASVTDLK